MRNIKASKCCMCKHFYFPDHFCLEKLRTLYNNDTEEGCDKRKTNITMQHNT